MKRKLLVVAAVAATVFALVGCSPSTGAMGKVNLTLWMAGDCPTGTCLETGLVKAFEKKNPNISVKIVTNPADNYFTGLKAASLTGTGPDLAMMWPGGYMTPFKKYMTDAHDAVSSTLIKDSTGTAYFSEDNKNSKAVYAIPTNDQYYIGFYNKKIFADNGITEVPHTWADLLDDAKKLKAAGIQPMISGVLGGGAQYQPLYEWSYLAAALKPSDWSDLYDGKMKYSNPTLVEQLKKWSSLYEAGYLNKDAFNNPDAEAQFTSGKAAMWLSGGSWTIPTFAKEMGDNLGIMTPPYSTTDRNVLVETAGTGYTVFKYSKHVKEAGLFQAFILSDEGQQIIADLGQPATRPGFKTSTAAINDLSKLAADPKTQLYPMFDNFTQVPVTDAITKEVGGVLVGQMQAEPALQAVDAAFDSLPADQKNVKIPLKDSK